MCCAASVGAGRKGGQGGGRRQGRRDEVRDDGGREAREKAATINQIRAKGASSQGGLETIPPLFLSPGDKNYSPPMLLPRALSSMAGVLQVVAGVASSVPDAKEALDKHQHLFPIT